MTAISKATRMAIIFGAIGVAGGIGIALFIVDQQTQGLVFQRPVEDDNNPWNDPAFLATYNENVRTGAYYKTRLAIGEEGFFISSAKGGKEPYTYEWKFSDGVALNSANVTRSFDSEGKYYFDLIVTDADGKQGKSTNMFVDVLQELPEQETDASAH